MRLTRTSPASKPDTNTTPAFAPRLPHAYPHAARLCGSFVATLDLVAPLSRPPTRRTAAHARRDERKRQADAMRESLREVQMRDIYLRLSQQKSAERARDDVRNESVVDGPAATELQESVWNNMANAHQITAKQHAERAVAKVAKAKKAAAVQAPTVTPSKGWWGNASPAGSATPQPSDRRASPDGRGHPSLGSLVSVGSTEAIARGSPTPPGMLSRQKSGYLERRKKTRNSYAPTPTPTESEFGSVLPRRASAAPYSVFRHAFKNTPGFNELMDTAPEKPRPPPPLAVPTGIPSENHRIVTSGYIDPSVAIEIAPSRRTTTGRASNVSFRDVQEGSSNAFIASESFRVGSPPPSMPVVRLSTQLEALEA